MSAYVVSDATIDALVTYAVVNNLSYYYTKDWQRITKHNAKEIAKVLMDENIRSVAHRYQDDPGVISGADKYRYRVMTTPVTPVEAMKLADCLSYQSCETDDWNETKARAILRAITECARTKFPGYDRAPWGITDHNDKSLTHASSVSLSFFVK